MKNIFIAAFIALLAIVGVWVIGTNGNGSNPDIFSCKQDSECVSVPQGCCNCNYGGKAIAINVHSQDAYSSDLSKECKETFCPAVISSDSSCTATPRCVNNKCILSDR